MKAPGWMTSRRLTWALHVTALRVALSIAYANTEPPIVWPTSLQTATISSPFRQSRIVIGISSRTASAISSLVWNGKQFVNSNDHGREIQSASYFENKGGCFNPTEAGSGHDGLGSQSTSQLKSLNIGTNQIDSTTQMAYWLGPGESSTECKGTVSTTSSILSEDLLIKTVKIGKQDISNAISFDVTFRIPEGRRDGIFEALTGYMPAEFNTFWVVDPTKNMLHPQSDGPGGQIMPLAFSTSDGSYALGVYSLSSAEGRPIYGRWKFLGRTMTSPTVKWNCVFQSKMVAPGDHIFHVYLLIGSLNDVRSSMGALCRQIDPETCK